MFSKRHAVLIALIAAVAYLVFSGKKEKLNPDAVKGLRVVVTGASSGIGEQIAYQMCEMGARVLVTARTESKLQKAVAECKKRGAKEAHYLARSMYGYDNATDVIKMALDKFGDIDVLVLNHIGQSYVAGYQYVIDDVEKLLMANTLTHAHMASISMQSLKKTKGWISVVSSTAAIGGAPYIIPYATSKFALEGFFASFRHELALNKTDVSISVSHLGLIGTDPGYTFGKLLPKAVPASKEECAAEIIRGTMARESDIYFPAHTKWWATMKGIFPTRFDQKLRELYKKIEDVANV